MYLPIFDGTTFYILYCSITAEFKGFINWLQEGSGA